MTKDKNKTVSGLRRIATLQTLVLAAKPRERHQLANRYARLENERARLEREIGIWENRRQAVANKLASVCKEIDAIRPLLAEVPAKKGAWRNGHGQRRTPAVTDVPGPSLVSNRTMQLEY